MMLLENVRRKYEKNSFALAIALVCQAFATSVEFYDEQQNNPSIMGIRLRIFNDSNAPINNAKLRYYFHRGSEPDTLECYYLAGATVSRNNVNGDLSYFELSIPSIPKGYYPDMAGFSLALHNKKYSNWGKSLDYSYQISSRLAKNTKVVLLSDDKVIFGQEPDVKFEPKP